MAEASSKSSSKQPDLEKTISTVETLYRSVTGRDAPTTERPYAAIPPEVDAGRYVETQMERLLDLLGAQRGIRTQPTWSPGCTLLQGSSEVVVRADLPGVGRDDVRITVQLGRLEISGVRNSQLDGWTRQFSEVPSGPFYRLIPLPTSASAEGAKATLTDGVLEIKLPLGSANTLSKSLTVS